MNNSFCTARTSHQRANLSPHVWGPHAWIFLYSIALAYPPTPSEHEKQAARNLITSLLSLLPCATCRVNYESEVNDGDVVDTAVQCSENLARFFYDVEVSVAKRNGKHEFVRSFDDVMRSVTDQTYLKTTPTTSLKDNSTTLMDGGGGTSPTPTGTSGTDGVKMLVACVACVVVTAGITWGTVVFVLRRKSHRS